MRRLWNRRVLVASITVLAALGVGLLTLADGRPRPGVGTRTIRDEIPIGDRGIGNARGMIQKGRFTFRHDTFGNEAFWSGVLGLEQTVGGLTPREALALGLKVDIGALPRSLALAVKRDEVDLDDPQTTLTLLGYNAVVGVQGRFGVLSEPVFDELNAVGITCSLCHTTVDDAVAPGIGRRLDGWANRDLDIGAIIASAPNLQPLVDLLGLDLQELIDALEDWGPGKFDVAMFLDGKTGNPVTGESSATLIPPVFGLAGVHKNAYTGWGNIAYWSAFKAVIVMGGQGTFHDPRLLDAAKFPIAAGAGFDDVQSDPDLVTPKLAALHTYQLSLAAPRQLKDTLRSDATDRGRELFNGDAQCATCHVSPLFTEPGYNAHLGADIGIEEFQAQRSPDEIYRTTPLSGLWTHTNGGFYHDGRFPTLLDVIDHYDSTFSLGLTDDQKADLMEYLKSL